ncbi:MAG: zinc ribbon domain-containing protein [Planctomycetota bacterium]
MTETRDVISTLKRIQEVDGKLVHVSRMKKLEPERLAEAEEACAASERLFGDLDNKHGELQRKISHLELDIKAKEGLISRHKSQMLTASNNREYQTLLHEISLEEVEKSRVEDQVLESMIQVEALAEEEKQIKAKVAEAKKGLEQMRREVAASLAELDESEKELTAARNGIAAGLPDDVLRQYRRLFESRTGLAVVPTIYESGTARLEGRYLCGGCKMTLSHQMINLLLLAKDLVYCTSCGRILFFEEQSEGEE